MTRNHKILFVVILAVATFLIFFRLGRADLLSDDGHYATRALGYFDFMSSAQQTTPLQWFGERPWWSYLSFHDHPPLYFFVQHIFFQLFGDTVVVSRLTSALAAVGTVAVMFFLGRRFGGATTGFLAMGAVAVNNYFIWQGRIGLLEALFTFWLMLGILLLVKGLEDNSKFFVWGGAVFGAALLSKYTVFFALLGIAVFLLWRERQVLRNKKFWLGVFVFFLFAAPLVVYNLEMYQARGHFDVQFADVFGQSNRDWPVLSSRVGPWQLDFGALLNYLGSGLSWPYLAAVAAAFAGVAVLAWRSRQHLLWLPLVILFSMLVFFLYVGAADRWLGVMAPLGALILAIALRQIWQWRIAWVAATVLAGYFLVYTFSTNHALAAPQSRAWVSTLRQENVGFNQLDKKLSAFFHDKRPNPAAAELVRRFWYNGIRTEAIDFESIRDGSREDLPYLVVYEATLPWFPTSWVFDRQRFYRGFFIADSAEFAKILSSPGPRSVFDQYLSHLGVLFIKSGPGAKRQSDLIPPETEGILKHYTDLNIEPEIIYDDKGREAFYIYDDLKRKREP